MRHTVAENDITYDLNSEDKDWRHRMVLRQQTVLWSAEEELQTHLLALGLEMIGQYQDWCLSHGFAPLLGKSRKQLQRELDFYALLCEQEKYVYDPSRSAEAGIRRVYEGQRNDSDPDFLIQIHKAFVDAPDADMREALLRVLIHLDQYTDLSYQGVMIPRLNEGAFVDGILALARHHQDFIRPIETWQSAIDNPRDLIALLSRHLLAPIGVPRFMDAAWFRFDDRLSARQQAWFKCLGKGFSICDADEPLRLTYKMGASFVHAPETFTIEEAMRYGQILGQGGDERLAEAIVDTHIGMSFRNSDFWDDVLTYFVRQNQLNRTCVGAVVDYLEAQRFERREVIQPDGSIVREKPPQPKLAIEGRSAAKLLRETEAWQLKLTVDDERTSAMTRWCLREDVLRRSFRKGTKLPRPFIDPVKHLFDLGMESDTAYRDWCAEHGFKPTVFKSWKERWKERDVVSTQGLDRFEEETVDEHIGVLGLSSREAYQSWCRDHNLSPLLNKTRRQQRREIRLMEKLKGERALAKARREMQQSQQMITAIYEGRVEKSALSMDLLVAIADGFELFENDNRGREALYALLMQVSDVAENVLSLERAINALGTVEGNTFVDGIIALALRHHDWIREPDDWRPGKYSNARRHFGSLARHLLAKYDVPVFMDSAWFLRGEEGEKQQDWFIHIGIGQNIRTADIPLRLTKMMAHCFLQAPDHFSVMQAFRYGQILGQAGNGALMRAILDTRLGQSFDNEDFWQTVIQFLVNSSMLDPEYVPRIVDYIYDQKYADQQMVHPDGRVETFPPPHPRFSMRGRSRIKLIRQVDRWLGFAKKARGLSKANWGRSGFEGLEHSEMDARTGLHLTWRVVEIRTVVDLVSEGREMRHCVGSYAGRCQRGNMSVWSLQAAVENDQPRRVMTIAVDNKRKRVSQSRGKFNAEHWVEDEGAGPNAPRRTRKLNRNDRIILMRSNRILGMWLRQEGIQII